jgi:hypothetical protein
LNKRKLLEKRPSNNDGTQGPAGREGRREDKKQDGSMSQVADEVYSNLY